MHEQNPVRAEGLGVDRRACRRATDRRTCPMMMAFPTDDPLVNLALALRDLALEILWRLEELAAALSDALGLESAVHA